jgi:formate/nitrite transporter
MAAAKKPDEIAEEAVRSGVTKARTSWDKTLVASFLAGSYISFGALVAVTISSGMDPEIWGTLPTLFTGLAFTLGLVLVLIAGSSLLTGNMLLVPLSAMDRRISLPEVARNLGLVLLGNVAGALFVAFFLAIETGVIGSVGAEPGSTAALTYERLAGIAEKKALDESSYQVFLRALGANWLVCLAVWMAIAADSVGSKILAMLFPVMAFVAMGFDHVVANMFFLPAAIFAGMPGLGWDDVLRNWSIAFLGNLVGGAVFVGSTYWYLYLKDQPEDATRAG